MLYTKYIIYWALSFDITLICSYMWDLTFRAHIWCVSGFVLKTGCYNHQLSNLLRLVRFFLLFLVDSPIIDLVIINVLLIITNYLIEIEIDQHHIIVIGCLLVWSHFESHNWWHNYARSIVLSLFQSSIVCIQRHVFDLGWTH